MAELVTDYLEGDLPWYRRIPARLHLFVCSACTHYYDQMRRTIGLLRGAPAQPPTPEREAVAMQSLSSGQAPE